MNCSSPGPIYKVSHKRWSSRSGWIRLKEDKHLYGKGDLRSKFITQNVIIFLVLTILKFLWRTAITTAVAYFLMPGTLTTVQKFSEQWMRTSKPIFYSNEHWQSFTWFFNCIYMSVDTEVNLTLIWKRLGYLYTNTITFMYFSISLKNV